MGGLISETTCCFCFTPYHFFSFSFSQELLGYVIDRFEKNLSNNVCVTQKLKTKQNKKQPPSSVIAFLGINQTT